MEVCEAVYHKPVLHVTTTHNMQNANY